METIFIYNTITLIILIFFCISDERLNYINGKRENIDLKRKLVINTGFAGKILYL